MNAINRDTQEVFLTKFNKERELERAGMESFVDKNGNLVLNSDQIFILKRQGWLSRQLSSATSDCTEEAATPRQRQYLVDLGVNIAGKQISKKLASELIDGAKSGSIGHLGFFFTDGSN